MEHRRSGCSGGTVEGDRGQILYHKRIRSVLPGRENASLGQDFPSGGAVGGYVGVVV